MFTNLDNFFNRFDKKISRALSFPDFDLDFGHDFPKADDPHYNYTQETVEKGGVTTVKERWVSVDGTSVFSRVSTTPVEKKESVEEIKARIAKAVADEDYETAARLKKDLEKKKKGE